MDEINNDVQKNKPGANEAKSNKPIKNKDNNELSNPLKSIRQKLSDLKRAKAIDSIIEFIKVAVISLVIVIPIRYFLIQPFFVRGASMENNFHDGDYLIVDQISYRFSDIKRGDIIIFKAPTDASQYYIKRVIALPGEGVQIEKGKVIIYNDDYSDGKTLDENYLEDGIGTYPDKEKIKLRDDEYFVLGDNREKSSDSRSWGPLQEHNIIGKAMIRLYPFNKLSKINHTDPLK